MITRTTTGTATVTVAPIPTRTLIPTPTEPAMSTRRDFLKSMGALAAVPALSASAASDTLGEMLPTRRLGRTGLDVTAFCLGGAHMEMAKDEKASQEVIETAITSGPFGHIAKQNIEFMRSAREALMPNLAGKKPEKAESIDDLKKQMADLQAKIDKLSAD